MSAADALHAELGLVPKKATRRTNGHTGESAFDLANRVSMTAILDRYGVAHDGENFADCPGCAEPKAKLCGGGVKCLHNRCSDAGPPGKAGFRTPVDIVAERERVEPLEAAKLICGWYNIELPKSRERDRTPEPPPDDFGPTDYDDAGVPDNETPGPTEKPTAAEPLRGLPHLARVATLGRARILELAAKPTEYVWQDIAVAGTIVLVAGPPAEGKTTLLFLIVAARLNTGQPVLLLGRRLTPAPPLQWLVLIEGEHSDSSTSRKLTKSLRLMAVTDDALDRVIIIARKAVRLGSPEWADVVRLVAAGLVSDIAIDTVARVAPADADSEREQVAIFDAVAQAIEAAPDTAPKPIVWAVAHTRKATTGGLADVSGSAQRAGQADTVLMLSGEKVGGRTVSTTVTFQKLREDPDDYPLPVTFSIAPGADGGPAITTFATGVEDDRPLEERIVEQLTLGPKTKSTLSTRLSRSFKDIDDAIGVLFEAHKITTTTTKVRGKDCKAFKLRSDAKHSDEWSGSFDERVR